MNFKTILLMGMPRSGTSWLSQIFDSNKNTKLRLSPLFSYAFKNAVNEKSSKNDWNILLEKVYKAEDDFMNQTVRKNKGEYPNFEEKNTNPEFLVIKDTRYHNLTEKSLEMINGLKIIYIVRNPCGAIHSWLTAPREFPATANPKEEWRNGKCRKTGEEEFWGFNDWKKVTTLYMDLQKKYPNKIKIISYEELVDNPAKLTNEIFEFTNLNLEEQTLEFLKKSQSSHVKNEYAVFKNPKVKDRWKNELNKNIINEIQEDLKNTNLEKFLN